MRSGGRVGLYVGNQLNNAARCFPGPKGSYPTDDWNPMNHRVVTTSYFRRPVTPSVRREPAANYWCGNGGV
jgi:hypothetical protein